MAKYLDATGLSHLWAKIKGLIGGYASLTTNNNVTTLTIGLNSTPIPVATDATPLEDGTASVGSSSKYSRGDHVHPHDSTKADKLTSGNFTPNNLVMVDANGNIVDSGIAQTTAGGTDTVNTAGATDTSDKIFIVGAKALSANPQTYTHDTAYVGTDGYLYSNSTKVDMASKANKPTGTVTAGHVATLDANGNLVDSGVSTSDIGTDTKNTTGSTSTTFGTNEKLYLVGAKTQAANPQTYSSNKLYLKGNDKLALEGDFEASYISAGSADITDLTVNDNLLLEAGDFSKVKVLNSQGTVINTLQSVLDSKLGSLVSGTNVKTINDNSIVGSGNLELTGYDIQMAMGEEQEAGTYVNDSLTVYTALYALDSALYSLGGKGLANGIASLDNSGRVPSSLLPSYVDDVVEVYPRAGQTALSQSWLSLTSGGAAITPLAGVIYVLMSSFGDYAVNTEFRWGGNTYVLLNDGGCSGITELEIDEICEDTTIIPEP